MARLHDLAVAVPMAGLFLGFMIAGGAAVYSDWRSAIPVGRLSLVPRFAGRKARSAMLSGVLRRAASTARARRVSRRRAQNIVRACDSRRSANATLVWGVLVACPSSSCCGSCRSTRLRSPFSSAFSPRMQAILLRPEEAVAVALLTAVVARSVLTRGPGLLYRVGRCDHRADLARRVFRDGRESIFAAGIPPKVELFGFRSSVFFMVLYYVGRGVPEIAERSTYIKHLFRIALVVAAIGVLERIFVTPEMLVALGAASYMTDFLGLTVSTAGNEWGLPSNYFSMLGRVPVRRAGSVFLGGQHSRSPFCC